MSRTDVSDAVCAGKPIKQHQALVVRCLSEQARDPSVLLKGTREWDTRIEYMVRDDLNANKATSKLDYHLVRTLPSSRQYLRAVVSGADMSTIQVAVALLADCATGNNPSVEIRVSALLSLDDVLEALVDLDVRKADGKVGFCACTTDRGRSEVT